MLNSNHPSDERLSAFASHDPDATAEASLTSHLSSCDRCTDFVNELGVLRASLAELPDLVPSRPLRLLPEVEAASSSVGWVRRIFAPMLTAGAALALVGMVGTGLPALDGMASGGAPQAGEDAGAEDVGGEEAPAAVDDDDPESVDDRGAYRSQPAPSPASYGAGGGDGEVDTAGEADGESEHLVREVPAERSPWPMVLFTGLAVMILAALLRWVLAPAPADRRG